MKNTTRTLLALIVSSIFAISALAAPVQTEIKPDQAISADTAMTQVQLAFEKDVQVQGIDVSLNAMVYTTAPANQNDALATLQKTAGHTYQLATPQQKEAFERFLETEKTDAVVAAKTMMSNKTCLIVARTADTKAPEKVASTPAAGAAPTTTGG